MLASADSFWALACDPHIRRYLLDGESVPRAWALAEVETSDRLFAFCGVGLWLVYDDEPEAIGFAGFRVFDEISDKPQLLYAFLERVTGRGYATEAGEALVRFASDVAGPNFDTIESAVDAPNAASARVLHKLGFVRTHVVPGAFGDIVVLRWKRQNAST